MVTASALPTLPNTLFMRFSLHPAVVYAHFLFNSDCPVKLSFENSLFSPFSAFALTLPLPYYYRSYSLSLFLVSASFFSSLLLPVFPLLEFPRRLASRPEDAP